MAVLSNADRVAIWQEWMRANSDPISITKGQLRAAIDAIDDWIDSNAASFNNALPTAARTSLTGRQKAFLFMYVANRRFGVL